MKKPLRDLPEKWNEHRNIYSNDIEGEIWNIFENLSGRQYLESTIKSRIKSEYFRYLTNSIITSRAQDTEQIQVITDEDVPAVVDKARNIIIQAKAIYFAAKPLSLLSKPILLFYCFEKLAELLYIMTWKETESKYQHGLKYDSHIITIKRYGLFSNLHDSHTNDPFYLNGPQIKFEDIIMCGPINQLELDTQSYRVLTHPVNTLENKQIALTEIDREFIFLYGLSILARYNIKDWSRLLSGTIKSNNNDENPLSNNIKIINHLRSYLRAAELMFPNLILDEIYTTKISVYYPMKLMSTEFEEYDDKLL